jgi:hypothetical protein
VRCAVDNCGSCRPIYYDEAGSQVCKEKRVYDDSNNTVTTTTNSTSTTTTTATTTTCASDDDCVNGSEYCAAGSCIEISKCIERVDCTNPSNSPYPAFDCVGYLECIDGQCQMECGPSLCPDDEETVDCNTQPCDVEDCSEAASCENDNCGSCKAIFFDAAGNQVCKPENDLYDINVVNETIQFLPCYNDAECLQAAVERSINGDYYCARGFCLEKGTCGTDDDCDNPANEFDTIFCVGYYQCNEGVCGRVCGPSCADGSVEEVCEPDPCASNPTCPGSVSCINDRCNGCNAVYFSASGFKMSCDDDAEPAVPELYDHDPAMETHTDGVTLHYVGMIGSLFMILPMVMVV